MSQVPLGLSLTGTTPTAEGIGRVAREAESLGYRSLWSAEAWGSDAFTPLACAAATTTRISLGTGIAQIAARTPAATAMTALTLQQISGGRLLLGLGVSGPQVVEGWHGVPFSRPLATTREYIAVLRKAMAADEPVEHHGDVYQLPYRGPDATGLGRPLRATLPGAPETPILVAAVGPKNVQLAVEVADGLLPFLWSPTRWRAVWGEALGGARHGFQVAPTVWAVIGDDLERCRDAIRPKLARYLGGMGAKGRNFYANLVAAYGYGDAVERVQDLYLGGDRKGAVAAVPDELVDDLALVGSVGQVRDRLAEWADGPVTTVIADPIDANSAVLLAEANN